MQEKTLVLQRENPSTSVESSSETLTTIVSSRSEEDISDDANESFVVSFYVTNTVTS